MPWRRLGVGGRVSVLCIVLVNPAHVYLGVTRGDGSTPPVFELMQSLAYSGNLSSAGGNSGKCNGQTHIRGAPTKCTPLHTIPSPLLTRVSAYQVSEAIRATTLQHVCCFIAFSTSVTQMHVSVPHTADSRTDLQGRQWARAYSVLPWTRRPGPEGGAYQNWAVFFCSLAFVYIILPLILLGEKFHPKMLPTATKQWVRIVCTVCLVFIF